MVFIDNVRQFFADHPEIYGNDPTVQLSEFIVAVSSESLNGDVSPTDDFEGFVLTTKVTSGEVSRILGENFDLFARDLELPQHRAILGRAFAQ